MTNEWEEWEKGTPITSQELLILFQEHINGIEDTEAAEAFVNGKKNTVHQFVGRVLKANISIAFEKIPFHRVFHWIGGIKQKKMHSEFELCSRMKKLMQ